MPRPIKSFFISGLMIQILCSTAFGLQLFPAKLNFATKVPGAFAVVVCQGHLWAYSRIEKQFYALSPTTGAVQGEASVTSAFKHDSVSAVACFEGKLLVAFTVDEKERKYSLALFNIGGVAQLSLSRTLPPPEQKRISDLKCHDNGCLAVVGGKVFRTDNLKTWKDLKVPATPEITLNTVDTKTNPFSGWQEKLLLSKGIFTRAELMPSGDVVVLDPLRTTVVSIGPKGHNSLGKVGRLGGQHDVSKRHRVYGHRAFCCE